MSMLFWLSLLLLAYTYVGYPVLLGVLVGGRKWMAGRRASRGWGTPPRRGGPAADSSQSVAASSLPAPRRITVVLVVHNESARMIPRLDNLEQCERLWEVEILVVGDGCTDDTMDQVRAWVRRSADRPAGVAGPGLRIEVIEQAGRRGKAGGLNRGIAAATGDIVVFADARQRFNRFALTALVAPFADPSVAAVSGNLEIASSDEGTGAGIDAYWKLERRIRRLESEWDSVIGCTGAIYALRRDAFEPLPEDTILDDVVIPMRALVSGRRVLFEAEAIAFDPQELAPEREQRRKIRTLAGNYQMLFRHPEWLLPWRNRAWWQLISHKYLRLAGPFLLAVCLLSSAWLARESLFFRLCLAGQLLCYAAALVGMAFRAVRSPLFTAPAGFLFLQWQGVRALAHYLRLRGSARGGVWS